MVLFLIYSLIFITDTFIASLFLVSFEFSFAFAFFLRLSIGNLLLGRLRLLEQIFFSKEKFKPSGNFLFTSLDNMKSNQNLSPNLVATLLYMCIITKNICNYMYLLCCRAGSSIGLIQGHGR